MGLSLLLEFWKPIAIVLLVGLLVAGILWMKSSYDEGKREEGRSEVQVKWDADKAARIKRTTEITLEMYSQIKRAEDAAIKRGTVSSTRFTDVKAGIHSIPAGNGVSFSASADKLFNDTSSAANSNRTNTGAKEGTNPLPATPQTESNYDEREFVSWVVSAGEAYADAYNLWKFCRDREDSYLTSMLKGANP